MLVRVVGYLRRNHLALIALFFAIGGTSYAAASLAPNERGNPAAQEPICDAREDQTGGDRSAAR